MLVTAHTQGSRDLPAPRVGDIRILLDHGYVLCRVGDTEAFLRRVMDATSAALLDLPYVAWKASRPDRYVRLFLVGATTHVEFSRTPVWTGSEDALCRR